MTEQEALDEVERIKKGLTVTLEKSFSKLDWSPKIWIWKTCYGRGRKTYNN